MASQRSATIVLRLEARAKAVGLSVADLHSAASVHRATWNRWRAGTSAPSIDQVAAVEELLTAKEAPRDASTENPESAAA